MELRRKIKWLSLTIVIAGSIISACGGGTDEAEEPPAKEPISEQPAGETPSDTGNEASVADGEEIVQANCISCHGDNLEGGFGPSLRNLSDTFTEEEIKDILVNGKGSMPGGLAKGNEDAVIAYLLSLE